MKKLIALLMMISMTVLLAACDETSDSTQQAEKGSNGKPKIVEYGDFKCPYCKKVEDQVLPQLKKDYIDQDKVDYEFVNMAFLGKDSIIGSRAGHAVKQEAPEHYLTFQHLMFEQQPDNEKPWITEKLVDAQIDELEISSASKARIKDNYKEKNSKAWKAAKQDQQRAEDQGIKKAPTVIIEGETVDDPYHYKSYQEKLDEALKK
ncbi:DsbA family protein [Staphylococcus auricularis]|uniref:DsbA family protein n=1 Tax=Staphylococcus auricularis TaxID=29379 RepID=UPI003EBA5130